MSSNSRVGRNDPCPCGSGRKYKRCCLNSGIVHQKKPTPPQPGTKTAHAKESPDFSVQAFSTTFEKLLELDLCPRFCEVDSFEQMLNNFSWDQLKPHGTRSGVWIWQIPRHSGVSLEILPNEIVVSCSCHEFQRKKKPCIYSSIVPTIVWIAIRGGYDQIRRHFRSNNNTEFAAFDALRKNLVATKALRSLHPKPENAPEGSPSKALVILVDPKWAQEAALPNDYEVPLTSSKPLLGFFGRGKKTQKDQSDAAMLCGSNSPSLDRVLYVYQNGQLIPLSSIIQLAKNGVQIQLPAAWEWHHRLIEGFEENRFYYETKLVKDVAGFLYCAQSNQCVSNTGVYLGRSDKNKLTLTRLDSIAPMEKLPITCKIHQSNKGDQESSLWNIELGLGDKGVLLSNNVGLWTDDDSQRTLLIGRSLRDPFTNRKLDYPVDPAPFWTEFYRIAVQTSSSQKHSPNSILPKGIVCETPSSQTAWRWLDHCRKAYAPSEVVGLTSSGIQTWFQKFDQPPKIAAASTDVRFCFDIQSPQNGDGDWVDLEMTCTYCDPVSKETIPVLINPRIIASIETFLGSGLLNMGIPSYNLYDSMFEDSFTETSRDYRAQLLDWFGRNKFGMRFVLLTAYLDAIASKPELDAAGIVKALDLDLGRSFAMFQGGSTLEAKPLTKQLKGNSREALEHLVEMLQGIFNFQTGFLTKTHEVQANVHTLPFAALAALLTDILLKNPKIMQRKATLNLFSVDRSAAGEPPPLRIGFDSRYLDPKQALLALLPLADRYGFAVSLDGRELHQCNADDLQSEISLTQLEADFIENKSQNIDWFSLNPKVFFQGKPLTVSNLNEMLQSGIILHENKLYLLPQKALPALTALTRFWNRLSQIRRKERFDRGDKFFPLPKNETLQMLALRKAGISVIGGASWKRICAFFDQLDQPRPFQSPPGLKVTLMPYQEIGVRWLLDLYELRLGGILGDDMGLGKTIQTLAFLMDLWQRQELGSSLIVMPTSLLYNWQQEILRHAPDLPVRVIASQADLPLLEKLEGHAQSLVLTTYGLLTRHHAGFAAQGWNVVAFDEAQNLKSLTSKRTEAARQLKATFKLCLTGTPMENHYGEFFALLDLAVPGSLGEWQEFNQTFVQSKSIAKSDIDHLRRRTQPLLLRRRKLQILDQLPTKTESVILVPFESKQRKIYRDVAISWNDKVQNLLASPSSSSAGQSQLMMLTALLRLRQACSAPSGLPGVTYTPVPPKLELLADSLEEITAEGSSALVFTQFIATMERLLELLNQRRIRALAIHGGTSSHQRQENLKRFQEGDEAAVLVMTLKTGGVGLNLTRASYVFHLEPWWNPAVENQATDRAHRLGQTQAVQVYRYIMQDSVEEKIQLLKSSKSAKFSALLDAELVENANENLVSAPPKGDTGLSRSDFSYLIQ